MVCSSCWSSCGETWPSAVTGHQLDGGPLGCVLKPSSAACLCSSCQRYHCHAWLVESPNITRLPAGSGSVVLAAAEGQPLAPKQQPSIAGGTPLLPRRRQRPAANLRWRLGWRHPGGESQPTIILAVGNGAMQQVNRPLLRRTACSMQRAWRATPAAHCPTQRLRTHPGQVGAPCKRPGRRPTESRPQPAGPRRCSPPDAEHAFALTHN